MKKISTAILALLYLAVSSGIAMEIHYCMGKKVGTELYGSSGEKCGKCGMTEKESGCCHDEFRLYKVSDSHYSSYTDISLAPDDFIQACEYNRFQWQMPVADERIAGNNHSPPDGNGPSPCIRNGVFRL